MRSRAIITICTYFISGFIILFLLTLSNSAQATSNCTYGPKEYRVIVDGTSPNRRFSVRAHGNGELGMVNFHVYLFAEPGHKKIGPLEEVTNVLDTCPGAFYAFWSPDNQYLSVGWRLSHQESTTALYRIANRRAYPIPFPNVRQALARHLHVSENLFPGESYEHTGLKWQNARRFQVFYTSGGRGSNGKRISKIFGKFMEVSSDSDSTLPDAYFGDIAAVATYEIDRKTGWRLISLRPNPSK